MEDNKGEPSIFNGKFYVVISDLFSSMYRAKRKKIKFSRPRIRCPVCGFLGWLSSFQKQHPIEMKLQYTRGGRGKRDFVSYRDVYDTKLLQGIRDYLFQCCRTAMLRLTATIIPKKVPEPIDEADRLEFMMEVTKLTGKKLKELPPHRQLQYLEKQYLEK